MEILGEEKNYLEKVFRDNLSENKKQERVTSKMKRYGLSYVWFFFAIFRDNFLQ